MINRHTKKLLILSVAVLSLCLLYGCGKKTNETESIASPSPTQSVTETPATGNAQTSDSEQSPDSSSTAPANTDDSSADSNAGASSTAPAATDNSSADSNTGASSVTSGVSNDEMAELARLYAATLDGMKPIETLHLPASSSEYSDILASEALSMCSQGGKSQMTKFLTSSGFEILLQANYDKSPSDPSHTCAFTLAKKKIFHNGTDRDLLVISIRGTESGEWFSNFDFAPSHSDDAIFAENFLQSAQDVYVRILPSLLENPDALILVCGHSRGAACANLLGMTLDDLRSKENVFVYTFATPGTIRTDYDEESYSNIFNLINPADMVTHLPLAGWGYRRVGNDIILAGNEELVKMLDQDMELLCSFAPSISDYYGTRHMIEGLDGFENGITAYETMLALASSMIGVDNPDVNGLKVTDIYKLSSGNEKAGELYPLLNFLQRMVGTDGNMNLNIFKQHMPAVYQELIAVHAAR